MVEADHRSIDALIRNCRAFPTVEIVHAAAVPTEDWGALVPFWECDDPALSTVSERLYRRGKGRETAVRVSVGAVAVRRLLAGRRFEFFSIDAEDVSIGLLAQVLEETRAQAGKLAICVEWFHADVFGENEPRDILRRASPYGFRELLRTIENIVLVRE
jgi:hypothetical protein